MVEVACNPGTSLSIEGRMVKSYLEVDRPRTTANGTVDRYLVVIAPSTAECGNTRVFREKSHITIASPSDAVVFMTDFPPK